MIPNQTFMVIWILFYLIGSKIGDGPFHFNYSMRFHDPKLGKFIAPDSVIPVPKNFGDWNRYTYVRNNPLKYIDPSGHIPQSSEKKYLAPEKLHIPGVDLSKVPINLDSKSSRTKSFSSHLKKIGLDLIDMAADTVDFLFYSAPPIQMGQAISIMEDPNASPAEKKYAIPMLLGSTLGGRDPTRYGRLPGSSPSKFIGPVGFRPRQPTSALRPRLMKFLETHKGADNVYVRVHQNNGHTMTVVDVLGGRFDFLEDTNKFYIVSRFIITTEGIELSLKTTLHDLGFKTAKEFHQWSLRSGKYYAITDDGLLQPWNELLETIQREAPQIIKNQPRPRKYDFDPRKMGDRQAAERRRAKREMNKLKNQRKKE